MLTYIIPSKTRRKILSLFFERIPESFHLRRVEREVSEEVNAVKRELDILEKEGLLHKEKRVNRVIYSLNEKYFLYDEFLRICTKTGVFVSSLMSSLSKLGQVKYIALSYAYVKKQKITEGEIALLFVGTIVVPEVSFLVEKEEKKSGRDLHYTVMTKEEFVFRKKNNDPFIWSFLKKPKIMLVGSEEQLVK